MPRHRSRCRRFRARSQRYLPGRIRPEEQRPEAAPSFRSGRNRNPNHNTAKTDFARAFRELAGICKSHAAPPTGSSTTYSYSTWSPPWSTSTSRLVWGSNYATHQTNFDGLGRIISTQDADPDSSAGYRNGLTTYNNLGQVLYSYNPYFTSGDATYGYTSYAYDALGRVTSITNPDSTSRGLTYSSQYTLATDESGIEKIFQSDGLGRLAGVCNRGRVPLASA